MTVRQTARQFIARKILSPTSPYLEVFNIISPPFFGTPFYSNFGEDYYVSLLYMKLIFQGNLAMNIILKQSAGIILFSQIFQLAAYFKKDLCNSFTYQKTHIDVGF